jgi:hypothetical protein
MGSEEAGANGALPSKMPLSDMGREAHQSKMSRQAIAFVEMEVALADMRQGLGPAKCMPPRACSWTMRNPLVEKIYKVQSVNEGLEKRAAFPCHNITYHYYPMRRAQSGRKLEMVYSVSAKARLLLERDDARVAAERRPRGFS